MVTGPSPYPFPYLLTENLLASLFYGPFSNLRNLKKIPISVTQAPSLPFRAPVSLLVSSEEV